MIKLTKRQQQVLDIIKDSIQETGYPPTRADIAQQLGFKSVNAAEEHLRALAKKGVIEIIPGTSRGIKLAAEQQGIPVVGRVAAGEPLLAQEHIEDYYPIANTIFSPQADYFLRVQGLSMQDVGILDGDLLAVHATPKANNGDIVVARIDDEVTVKRFKRINQKIVHLEAENSDFSTIVVDLSQQAFNIEGLSVGILRT